jgi:hypothetical protein
LDSTEPFRNGLAHGTARQYSNGKVVGSYVLKHGVGVDVWRNQRGDGSWYVSEVLWIRGGRKPYIRWMLREDEATLYDERVYGGRGDSFFEIERYWDETTGQPSPGYPRFMLGNKRVSKAKYLAARKKRRHLPPVRDEDRLPHREFPPVVVRAMKRKPR